MDVSEEKLNCQKAKEIDLVQYLSGLGHEPEKISGNNYWYLSPLRDEKTPSFKVNRKRNTWYDFGEATGGSIIDFGMLYFNCDIPAFLKILRDGLPIIPRFQRPAIGGAKEPQDPKIIIVNETDIRSISLLKYLAKRRIDIDVAQAYCREVTYLLNDRKHIAIGFKNNAGGYELRSPRFKGSSSPKEITQLSFDGTTVAVYEGFFDFLSYYSYDKNERPLDEDAVILNSVAFFDRAKPFLEGYEQQLLRLDNDDAGDKCTAAALAYGTTYMDDRKWYEGFKDINEWLVDR
jgi:hypothetical protein